MFLKLMVFVFLLVFSMGLSCCDQPAEPKENPDPNPTIRDFSWDIDTLEALPNYTSIIPADIWASSPTDVWIVGINPAWHGEVFHYDGKRWNKVSPNDDIALTIGTFNMDFTCIWGFGKNDIYVGGYTYYFQGGSERGNDFENLILHWDGIRWSVVHHQTQGIINSIHGNSPNVMLASGVGGTLLQKRNGAWERLNYLNPKYDYQPIKALPNGDFYMSAEKRDVKEGDTSNVYYNKYTNNYWVKIDSSVGTNNDGVFSYHPKGFAHKAYWVSPQGNLFGTGSGFHKLVNDKWIRVSNSYGGNDLSGTNETNIFECGNGGDLWQFDGNQWHPSKWVGTYIDFKCVWVFEKEVFCAGSYQGNGYVVKGKLPSLSASSGISVANFPSAAFKTR
ncbi:MAG: hypothetical protein LCH54_01115 [Bacteroidetes bacterium]|nr:hypothetical protein [Bacteroidota bacterium]